MSPDRFLPLLCRIPLFPDESLLSYLHRVTSANCYDYSTFTAICKDRLSAMGVSDILESPRHAETFDILSSLTGVEPRALANASVNGFSQTIPLGKTGQNIRLSDGSLFGILDWWIRRRYLRKGREAHFCPACLREFPYHRSIWIPLDVTTCLKHECLLVDHCGFCEALVSVQDIVRGRCHQCGKNLGDIPSRSLHDKPFDLFAQGTLQIWWGISPQPSSTTLWNLPAQPISVLYRVFEGFKDCLIDKQQVEQHLGLASALLDQHDLYAVAFGGLVNWPQGFYDLLKSYLHRKKIDGICFHPYFSRPGALIATWLFGLWAHEEFEFVQEAFDKFLIENPALFETTIWRQRIETRQGFAEKFPYLSKHRASQILNMRHSTVELLILFQEIDAYDRRSGQDVWVRREDVLEFREARRRENPS
ncbi:MAG: TniQ family protein [Chloroflexi bacterium]|nr:TniQ family protein [Chloroflexota bacterium]